MNDYIYLGGCDVGIKNLTFCFARVPIDNYEDPKVFLEKIEIDQLILLNLLTSLESNQQEYQKPSCCFESTKPCKSPIKYMIHSQAFCQRHYDSSSHDIWLYTEKPITKVHKKKRKSKSAETIDSDEEVPTNPTPATISSNPFPLLCGSCQKDVGQTRFHRYMAQAISQTANQGYQYRPLCISCVRNHKCPREYEIWPPQYNQSSLSQKENTILIGPAPTETEVIMSNLVRLLEEKFENLLLDVMFIENQPTMMNPRMKSIQMILYAYFQRKIRKENGGRCIFVSPNLKWKVNMPEIQDNATYREHKKESVRTFLQWIDQHRADQVRWSEFVKSEKKRDDLCDAFWLMISGIANWKISLTRLEYSSNQDDDS